MCVTAKTPYAGEGCGFPGGNPRASSAPIPPKRAKNGYMERGFLWVLTGPFAYVNYFEGRFPIGNGQYLYMSPSVGVF